MSYSIKPDELEQNFFSNIKPSFGLLRKMNFQIPPLSEICFWENIKNSNYARKYIEECFDYLLLNCSIIKATNPQSTPLDSSISHETASSMKSVLLALIHIATFYKNKISDKKKKDSSANDISTIQALNPLENKASIIIKNSSFPQIKKVIELIIRQLFYEPINVVNDIPSMINFLKSTNTSSCRELESTRFFNTILLLHRLKYDDNTKKLFYPSVVEILKSKLKISSNSTQLSHRIRELILFLYIYYLVMSIRPELKGNLHQILPFLNARITNSNPFSSFCQQLLEVTKKEIKYPGYCFYQMLKYASDLSPATNHTVTLFYDFQYKLFPNMMYCREMDKFSFKLSYIDFVNYYLTNTLGVPSEQTKNLSISDLLKILGMINFNRKDDKKILSAFKLQSTKKTEKTKSKRSEEEDDSDDQEDNSNSTDSEGKTSSTKENNVKVPNPPYIPFSLVRIPQKLYLNPDNLIVLQTSQKVTPNDDDQDKSKEKNKKKKEGKKKGKNENFEESYNDKKKGDDGKDYYLYNSVMHKVYTEAVFKPIFEYMKNNTDEADDIINHQILVCGNDSAIGTLIMLQLISSMQTDQTAKSNGLIEKLNLEIFENVNLKYYIFPFKNSSASTQIANFLASIDPIYDKFVKNIYDLTSHIAPTFSESSTVSFIPVDENTGFEVQKKNEATKPPKPPQPPKNDSAGLLIASESGSDVESSSGPAPGYSDIDDEKSEKSESKKSDTENDSEKSDKPKKSEEPEAEKLEVQLPQPSQPQTATSNAKTTNEFDNDSLWTCNPIPSSIMQLSIQHLLLFAREHVDVRVWRCVLYVNGKKIVIPFISGVRLGFTSGNQTAASAQGAAGSAANSAQVEENKPKRLIIETTNSMNETSDPQKVKLVSFSIWNANMELNCDPRSPLLLKEVCYTVSAHTQLMQRENLAANSSYSYSSNKLSLIDSQDKKTKKRLSVNTNAVPFTNMGQSAIQQGQIISPQPSQQAAQATSSPNLSSVGSNGSSADINMNEMQNSATQGESNDNLGFDPSPRNNSSVIDLNGESEGYHRVTKKMRDKWAKLELPKTEPSGPEQNLKVYTHEFIKGITVSLDKDQLPFNIIIDGVEYEQIKKFSIDPMMDPAKGDEQMTARLACFSPELTY